MINLKAVIPCLFVIYLIEAEPILRDIPEPHGESSSMRGRAFTLTEGRIYEGQKFNAYYGQPFSPPCSDTLCKTTAVLNINLDPREVLKEPGKMKNRFKMVGDSEGPVEYTEPGFTYLHPADQKALPHRMTNLSPWNNFGLNIGVMYDVDNGAKIRTGCIVCGLPARLCVGSKALRSRLLVPESEWDVESVDCLSSSALKVRNASTILGGFDAELQIYKNIPLVESFGGDRHHIVDDMESSPSRFSLLETVEDPAVRIFNDRIIDHDNGKLSQLRIQDVSSVGYVTDKLTMGKQERRYLRSIATGRQHFLLVIAIVSIRPERRHAIRESWLKWMDNRVAVRFFTEAPKTGDQRDEITSSLTEESALYGDLIILDIDHGMNFAVRLVSAMRWMSEQYSFNFFLRLDDDYFICLKRLLNELESIDVEETFQNPIFAGHRYCMKFGSRIDEAYMLLSSAIVQRILSTPDLQCGGHAGITAGWWLKVGGQLNKYGDVRWVHDPRLDHFGKLWKSESIRGAPPFHFPLVCETMIAVHHSYEKGQAALWEAVRGADGSEAMAVFRYIDDGNCATVKDGVTDDALLKDQRQPCHSFSSKKKKMYCGLEGC